MLINGKDYKVNVLILLMPGEVDVTTQTVETLLEEIEDGVLISILMNGGTNPELKEIFLKHNAVKYYESEENLGVAGGRNFLFKTEESKASNIMVILDNDIIPPQDYIINIVTFLLQQKDAGVVGPVIADVGLISLRVIFKYYGDRGVFGNKLFKIKSSEIKSDIINYFMPKKIYHMGTHPDFYRTYFSVRPYLYRFIKGMLSIAGFHLKDKSTFLRDNTQYQKLLLDGANIFSVTNVGGGTQVFWRSLIDKIGLLDNKFNPYGYEDVEFSTRALKAGYRNYIDLNTWIYHGTDMRHKERDRFHLLSNRFRCLTLYAASALPDKFKKTILKQIVFATFYDIITLNRNLFKHYKARTSGFKNALNAIDKEMKGYNPNIVDT